MLDICLLSDGVITTLESLDKQLLLELNGSDSLSPGFLFTSASSIWC